MDRAEALRKVALLGTKRLCLGRRRKLAEAYREYLESLAPEEREVVICCAGRAYARKDIPRALEEDDEFYEAYRKFLKSLREFMGW